jgi:hypothetical protein
MYENRIKPVEIVLRSGRIREMIEGVNLIRLHCMNI